MVKDSILFHFSLLCFVLWRRQTKGKKEQFRSQQNSISNIMMILKKNDSSLLKNRSGNKNQLRYTQNYILSEHWAIQFNIVYFVNCNIVYSVNHLRSNSFQLFLESLRLELLDIKAGIFHLQITQYNTELSSHPLIIF